MSRIPLELHAEVTAADGTRYRWGASEDAEDRPLNLSFRTKVGEGFSDASCQLARRIDRDYPDLNLVDTVTFVGADGSVAYEGRLAAMPRQLDTTHSIGVTLAGWMAHARDRKMTQVFTDRDFAAWREPSRTRRLNNLSAGFSTSSSRTEVIPNTEAGQAGLMVSFSGAWAVGFKPIVELTYDAGAGNAVQALSYAYEQRGSSNGPADANFFLGVATGPGEDDTFPSGVVSTGNIAGASSGNLGFLSTLMPGRFMVLSWYYNAAPQGADNASFEVHFPYMAAHGDGVPLRQSPEIGQPAGVVASEAIEFTVRRFCPALNTAGIQDTNKVIQHAAFKDPIDPYDVFLDFNKYHLWHLAVWEDRVLYFRPYDFSEAKWEVRTDDPGVRFTPQGPSTAEYFNGIVVSYEDLVTGDKRRLLPTAHAELRDTDSSNPWTTHGLDRWDEIQLSSPAIERDALEIGRTKLEERNQPKQPGTIVVQGYIRDQAANPQPVWKVRAGDMILISDTPDSTPRLVTETSYDDTARTMTLSIDRPAATIDAELDR